jgi:hypothetical protein
MKGNIMADSSPLAGLLDRARKVFSLASKLSWRFLPATLSELIGSLGELRDAIQSPPERFEAIAKLLGDTARNAKDVRDRLENGADPAFLESYLPVFGAIAEAGGREIDKARRSDDPLAFVGAPAASNLAGIDIMADSSARTPSGVSWETLCRMYPATFSGLVGDGFYRKRWIEAYQRRVKVDGCPPLLQRAYDFARPIELAARLLACGLAPDEVKKCVLRTDENRDYIYSVLSRGNGLSADDLLHLFTPTAMPAANANPFAAAQAQLRQSAKELFDTTPAPEPSEDCPTPCAADKRVRWPRADEIDLILSEPAAPEFTLLDRFPATPKGHVGFLEFVCDEVHYAAEAKRGQFVRGYSNSTIESMVRGIKWGEAGVRLAAVPASEVPADAVEQVARVLRRELTARSVERIAELLTPTVRVLRDAWENSRAGGLAVLLDTAVQAEHGERNERTRQFWIQECGMPANLTYEEGQVWAQERQAQSDATEMTGRDKAFALERMIETRCRERMLAAGFLDDELKQGSHVRYLPDYVDVNDPRMPAFQEAMMMLKLEEQAKARVLGCAPAAVETNSENVTAHEAIEPNNGRARSAPTQMVLRQCGAELEQTLNHATGIIRHAFFALGGSSETLVTKTDIDLSVGEWLGGDKYHSLFMGPVRYPLSRASGPALWHVYFVNGTANLAENERWLSTLANLDRLSRDGAFDQAFADERGSDGWLLLLYQIAMRHPEYGFGEVRGASLPEAGGILPSVFLDRDFFGRWLAGTAVLPDGDHFVLFFDDIRTCSLRALRLAGSRNKSQTEPVGGTGEIGIGAGGKQTATGTGDTPTKTKRSTERGEGRAKLLAALTKHHQHADGSCLNLEPIGNNALARLAGVSESTASEFFRNEFEGHAKYRGVCRNAGRLADSLKALNGEFSPHELYGRRPAHEADREDVDDRSE